MMALFHAYRGPRVRSLALSVALGMTALAAPATAADINIVLDQAKLVKLPERIATIVVGNPLIADASLQAGGQMIITGKGYGITNLLALDRAGAVLLEQSIEVRGPDAGVVVLYRGVERETYNCTPHCQQRVTLGDSQPYFSAVLGQTGTRNGQAQGASAK
jgi:Flp pilus assembly secretin CpaC